MSKYVKIAALLPDKTVRDVALRCHWLSVRLCLIANPNYFALRPFQYTDVTGILRDNLVGWWDSVLIFKHIVCRKMRMPSVNRRSLLLKPTLSRRYDGLLIMFVVVDNIC